MMPRCAIWSPMYDIRCGDDNNAIKIVRSNVVRRFEPRIYTQNPLQSSSPLQPLILVEGEGSIFGLVMSNVAAINQYFFYN